MKKFLIFLIKLLLLTYITFGVVLFINQRDLLYAPTVKTNHVFDEVIFHNEKESINVIVVNDKKEKAILYFGAMVTQSHEVLLLLIDFFLIIQSI